jgi:hypothetical protein
MTSAWSHYCLYPSDILPPDSLSPPKLQPARTFEDLLKAPTIDGLEESIAEFPAVIQEAALQPFSKDREMARQKELIKETLEKLKASRDPLANLAASRDPLAKLAASPAKKTASDSESTIVGLEAPPWAVKKVPPKKDDSHVNLSAHLDIIAPTIGRGRD